MSSKVRSASKYRHSLSATRERRKLQALSGTQHLSGDCQALCSVCQYNKQSSLLHCSLTHVPSLSSAAVYGEGAAKSKQGLLCEDFRHERLENLHREKREASG